jgi:hypothetical protein
MGVKGCPEHLQLGTDILMRRSAIHPMEGVLGIMDFRGILGIWDFNNFESIQNTHKYDT